ncbi:MAG: pyruvate:ferredoxin (flavodoxin) oxidoreductase [Clostridium sp.]|nr:pyruvate:ferredoxin (flavodoxin) oxidoreductase [Clostridium sp.]
MKLQSMDGCTAAAYVAYAFSEVATIYPITPIASMGETADKWHASGLRNLLGATMEVREMESELGAAGATHGALCGGALATTFTSSQGLMLMIPNMYKIAGELLPAVFHVGCRSLATHALSIFGDHQDVMACRATGFAMLASASVQETHDLAVVAHRAAIRGRVPVLHFFDGWRTSNETATIEVASFDELAPLLPAGEIAGFRSRAMNPEHPSLRGSAQNWDVYFQNTEARNRFYDSFPSVVQEAMDRVNALTGRDYHLVDYVGAPDAEDLIVSIGSSTDVIEYTIGHLNKSEGRRLGLVKIRLYRPFPVDAFIAALPATTRRIAVLDRTKEPGSTGEPLLLDVIAAVRRSGRDIAVIGGRYGLGSKNFDPTMVRAVYDNLASAKPIGDFTVGIDDDVTGRSLPLGEKLIIPAEGVTSSVFYGMGSDGTVGATRVAAQIIGDAAGLRSQAYFEYSAKKSGGYTVCQLRFGRERLEQAYQIESADYIGCNKSSYVGRFDLAANLAPGGVFVVNSPWKADEFDSRLPGSLKRRIAECSARVCNIDAGSIARANGLGVRINMIMLAVFFKLRQIIPFDKALTQLEQYITKLYAHEGGEVVARNIAAVRAAAAAVVEIGYDREAWLKATDAPAADDTSLPDFVRKIARPCNELKGDSLPVSLFAPDGMMPMGTTAYEKRRIADFVPKWDPDKCVECTQCSLVCAHAAIRPYVADATELAGAPAGFAVRDASGKGLGGMKYRIQVYPADCTGCASCATICPGHALTMSSIAGELAPQSAMLAFAQKNIPVRDGLLPRTTVRGSQMCEPMLEFSGACAGCGETPYVKLLTQLMGERMIIANATGCSSIWGANFPSNAYCTNRRGQGPAWGNSLFEDNAEYGFGIATAIAARRSRLAEIVREAAADSATPAEVATAMNRWLDNMGDPVASATSGTALTDLLRKNPDVLNSAEILAAEDLLAKKSVWVIGGDGWAYDIGFAGLDHVMSENIDLNILVMDTECYSNTGGQMSKATPLGAVAKYASDGKRTYKKDLGRMMMTYPGVYVASVSLGANPQQVIDAMVAADRHPGTSIVIAYCPCINHGIRTGMSHSIVEEREAVLSGYWPIYRRDPAATPALTVDCAAPDGSLIGFINGEDRYADLRMNDPAAASTLQPELEARCDAVHDLLVYNAIYVATVNGSSPVR